MNKKRAILLIILFIQTSFPILGQAWQVPSYLRLDAGVRLWFSELSGDLIQDDKTKIGIDTNLGLKPDQLTWEIFGSGRFDNIHVVRINWDTETLYENPHTGSSHKVWNIDLAYDLDFYMTPRILFGTHSNVSVLNLKTLVSDVEIGEIDYNYSSSGYHTIPGIGLHAAYYPIMGGVAIRPTIMGRASWWNQGATQNLKWEVSTGMDVPLTSLWTWSLCGGYQFSHTKLKRDADSVELNRKGFFIQGSLLF